jgi:hypothetical protein
LRFPLNGEYCDVENMTNEDGQHLKLKRITGLPGFQEEAESEMENSQKKTENLIQWEDLCT